MSEKNKVPKPKKEAANKFEEKLHINTSLDDVLSVSVPKTKKVKKEQ